MGKKKHSNIFKFPFIILGKDQIIWCWLVTTIIGALFTIISQFLIGEPIEDTFQQGNIYIFSITLLITVFSDTVIYLFSEDKKLEANKKLRELKIEDEKLLPIIGKASINSYLLLILLIITLILITSLLLYSGRYRCNSIIQLVIFLFSIYISFFYYCLNRLIQYPQNYEDYLETENKEMENLDKNNEEIKSFKNDTGKDVSV